jgi:hypothetical protein
VIADLKLCRRGAVARRFSISIARVRPSHRANPGRGIKRIYMTRPTAYSVAAPGRAHISRYLIR